MAGAPLYAGAVNLRIEAYLPVPASWSKRKQADALSGAIRPSSRPDVDNFAKAVLDGLNGIIWKDDAQVVSLLATKAYAETPRVVVMVEAV